MMADPHPDDEYDEPLSNKEIDAALMGFASRRDRRRIIAILNEAKLVVFPDD